MANKDRIINYFAIAPKYINNTKENIIDLFNKIHQLKINQDPLRFEHYGDKWIYITDIIIDDKLKHIEGKVLHIRKDALHIPIMNIQKKNKNRFWFHISTINSVAAIPLSKIIRSLI